MQQNTHGAEPQKNGAESQNLHLRKIWALINMAVANTATWMLQNRRTYPGFIFRAGTVGVGIVLAAFALHMTGTAFGRIAEDVIMQVALAVSLVLFLTWAAMIAANIYVSFQDTWECIRNHEPQAEKPAKMLSAKAAQTWTPPDISPDILVCGTDKAAFAENVVMAEKRTTNAVWAVIIPPFKTEPSILTAEKATDYFFIRGCEPFAEIVPAELSLSNVHPPLDHINETEKQYQQYVTWFCHWYKQWRTGAKLEADKARAKRTYIDIILEDAKAVTAALCFFLLCLPAFGQSKSRQVDEALGTRIREIPQAGEKVTFSYEEGGKEKYYNRIADGKSDYVALLQKTTGVVQYNDEGGQLVAVTKNGEVVARGAMVERVNLSPSTASSREAPNGYATESVTADPIRPRGAIPTAGEIAETPRTDMPMEMTFPDSAEMADRVDRMQYEMYKAGRYANSVIRPWWELFMWAYWDWFWLICIVTGVSWLFASSFATEGFWAVHRNAKIILLGVTVASASIFIVNIILWAKWVGIGPFWLAVITGVLCGSAYWLLIKINPDFRPAPGNDARSQDDPYYQQRQKAISAGR